jgi:hypothetical protein
VLADFLAFLFANFSFRTAAVRRRVVSDSIAQAMAITVPFAMTAAIAGK